MGRRLRLALAAALTVAGGVAPGSPACAATSGTVGIAPAATEPVGAARPSSPPEEGRRLEATVEHIAPRIADPTKDITFTVTVTNHGRPVRGLRLGATICGLHLTERGQVGTWLAARTASGPALTTVAGEPSTAPLPQGATRTVTVTVPHTAWTFRRPFAAVPVELVVSATDAGPAGGPVTGRTRTVVPWVARTPEYVPLQLAWAAPLTAPADQRLFTSRGADTLAAWKETIGPASAIRRRLDAAGSTPVTWLVDPTIVDAPRFVAGAAATAAPLHPTATPTPSDSTTSPSATGSDRPSGTTTPTGTSGARAPRPDPTSTPTTSSQTASPHPSPTPSPSSPAPSPGAPGTPADPETRRRVEEATALTKELVTRLGALPATQTVWSLPPGDPDVAAMTGHASSSAVTSRAFPHGPTPLDGALGRTVPRTTAWPADGLWSTSRGNRWSATTGGYPMTAALVSSAGLHVPSGLTPAATNSTAHGTPLLAYDEELSDIAGGTATATTDPGRAQVVQRFLAESLVLLGEREGTARGTIVALPRSTTTDPATLQDLWAATGEAPWLRPTTLPALAARLPAAPRAQTHAPKQPLDPLSPLTPTAVDGVEGRLARTDGLGTVLARQHTAYADVWGAAGTQLLSARWRGHPGPWKDLGRSVDSSLSTTADAVQVAPANVNFLADAGAVSITVTNDLPYPVSDVHLDLTPGNGKLRVDSQPQPIAIRARSRRTVRVDVTALGSGDVPVVAQLTTPAGTPLGTPRTVTMNVRPPKEWLIYVAGGFFALVLVAGLVRTLTRKPTRAVRDDLA